MPQRYVSNELTHFVGRSLPDDEARYALLVKILRDGLLTSDPGSPAAQARWEGVVGSSYTPGAPFSEPGSYSIDCVCFCDIPVPDLPVHMAKYSQFGLAFTKAFLITKAANAVSYWAANGLTPGGGGTWQAYFNSQVANFHGLIDSLRADYPSVPAPRDNMDGRLEGLFGFVNFMLNYTKLFDASLPDSHPDSYYMEREWRLAGNIAFELQHVERVILPRAFAGRLRRDVPEYIGQIHFPS